MKKDSLAYGDTSHRAAPRGQLNVSELIASVEKATGPNAELDHEIARVLDGANYRKATWQPPVTGSLEAVIALVEREMPGMWGWDTGRILPRSFAASVGKYNARHTTPALALLLAFLKARNDLKQTHDVPTDNTSDIGAK